MTAISAIAIGVWQGTLKEPEVTNEAGWAIEFLESCRDTHQYYLDNVDKQNDWTGDTNRHAHLINDYNKTIEILRSY